MDPYALLRAAPYFATVSSAKIAGLAKVCSLRTKQAGELVVRAGTPQTHVHYLCEGALAFYRRNPVRGITLLLGRVVAPSLFGDMEQASGQPWAVTGRAETECTCVLIPNRAFEAFIEDEAAVLLRLYKDASVRHMLANHSGQAIALYDVESRLYRVLLDYAATAPLPNDTARITPAPSQVELAAVLGVHRRTIARTLEPLMDKGVVTREGDTLVLHGVTQIRRSLPRDLMGLTSQGGSQPRRVADDADVAGDAEEDAEPGG